MLQFNLINITFYVINVFSGKCMHFYYFYHWNFVAQYLLGSLTVNLNLHFLNDVN